MNNKINPIKMMHQKKYKWFFCLLFALSSCSDFFSQDSITRNFEFNIYIKSIDIQRKDFGIVIFLTNLSNDIVSISTCKNELQSYILDDIEFHFISETKSGIREVFPAETSTIFASETENCTSELSKFQSLTDGVNLFLKYNGLVDLLSKGGIKLYASTYIIKNNIKIPIKSNIVTINCCETH